MIAPHEESFDVSAFHAIVEVAHSRYDGRMRDQYVSDPRRVQRRAYRYATRVQERRPAEPGMRPMLTARDVAAAAYAGAAVYSMDKYGFIYTYLARISWPGVANLVREISHDVREDIGVARQRLQRRIYDASELGQLVSFSELVETAKGLKVLVDEDEARGLPADRSWLYDRAWTGLHNHHELACWVDHAAAMINNMHNLFFPGATAMAATRAKMTALLVELGEKAKVRQARRAARARMLAGEAVGADRDAEEGEERG